MRTKVERGCKRSVRVRRSAILLLLAIGVGGLANPGAGVASPADPPIMAWKDLLDRPRPKPDATIRYGKDALQLVDIWRPAGAERHPAVIMIHGGCWKTAIAERGIMNWIADDLRSHGVGVWNIEYRGVDRGGGMPQTYQDIGAAADLFAARGAEFGLQTDAPHIVIGHSAGGHLALWLARRRALPAGDSLRGPAPLPIDLAISQGGLPDLRAQAQTIDHGCGTDGAIAMSGEDFARSSPPEMPGGTARELLFNNDRDPIAPSTSGAAYVAAMAIRGRGVEMVTTPNEGHVELIAPDSISWNKQRSAILTALKLAP